MTGPAHIRWLISSRMMQAFCQRYALPVSVENLNYTTVIRLPERVSLSSSILSEWSDIIGKYTRYFYDLTIEEGRYKITVR